MPSRSLDAEIDRLYQLPLEEFTAARNALAKESGKEGAEIRRLQKPPVAAWAVNQVYWKRRAAYDALLHASKALRAAHASVLGGKRADLRGASNAHEEALETALRAALAILQDAGQPATDSTKQVIATTLRVLPTADPPGRLTRSLQPGGFEQLADLPIRVGRGRLPSVESKRDTTAARSAEASGPRGAQAKAVARAKETLVILTRALRSAEQTSRQEEFEAARAVREADRAAERANAARRALEAAQDALAKAEREEAAALRRREATARRAREAEEALTVAQFRADAAQKELTHAQKK